MDANSHRRAAEEDERQIHHWQEQIALAEREFEMRIENFKTEIRKHEDSMRSHLEHAAQMEHDEEKRHKELLALELIARNNQNAA